MDLLINGLYVFLLAAVVGYHIIHKVPPLLHTPLMSATNAISGIAVVGALLVAGAVEHHIPATTLAVEQTQPVSGVYTILGAIAVAAAVINVVGGFLITDRMLKMFKRRDSK